ncbi:hypothetical protein [Bradyrhizobium sp. 131]|uniref:hypothetical protein n=1 Tax=Bradyrhizobium sp. 131 TaxID=2782609 RepID=UPI001FFF8BB3|nr:hypothetical protein [Bradyrhizobium sp. 131]
MLSQYLAKYVDQQRSLGFKFRVQQILLRGYVGFAEERGDRHIRSAGPGMGRTSAVTGAAPQSVAYRAAVRAGDARR